MKRLLHWLPSLLLVLAGLSLCAQQAAPLPSVTVDFGKSPSGPAMSSSLQALMLLTVLSLAPTILMTATSFTRITVVLHFLRQGLGQQQTPSNQVLISLSLVLTFFIMAPTAREINTTVLLPLQRNELTTDQALERTSAPLKVFMLRYTRKKDLSLFLKIAKAPAPKTKAEVPIECLLPAFLISELKTAFEIGFMIFLPDGVQMGVLSSRAFPCRGGAFTISRPSPLAMASANSRPRYSCHRLIFHRPALMCCA